MATNPAFLLYGINSGSSYQAEEHRCDVGQKRRGLWTVIIFPSANINLIWSTDG